MERNREVLLLKSDSPVLPDKITEEPRGGHSKNVIGKSLRRRVLPEFALSTLIMNPVVNLVVMATGDLGQLWVHHIRFLGIILPSDTMRITDAIEQPGGCVAYLMDQSIPESVFEEE